MNRTKTWQKIALLSLSILLSLALLELGLRAAGAVFTYLQERANRSSLRKEGDCVILCLGESTTAIGGKDAYPRLLEEILNEKDTGIHFSVVNKGIVGTNTTVLVEQIEDNLKQYRPDIVVTMMGINESVGSVFSSNPPWAETPRGLLQFRVYKVFSLLRERIRRWIAARREKRDVESEMKEIFSAIAAGGPGREGETPAAPSADARRMEAFRLLEEDEWEEAIPILEELGQKNPGDPKIATRLGACYRKIGKLDDAEALLLNALKDHPQAPETLMELGALYEAQERWEAADLLYRKVMELEPGYGPAFLGRAEAYEKQEKWAEAEATLKEGIRINPGEASLLIALGNIHEATGGYAEAEKDFEKAIGSDPEDREPYLRLAEYYQERDEPEKAENMYRKAIAKQPKNFELRVCLGQLYQSLEKEAEADNIYREAARMKPASPEEALHWGRILAGNGRCAEAIPLLTSSLKDRRLQSQALIELGICFRELERYEAAEQVLEKALEINPGSSRVYLEMGVLKKRAGKREEAKEYFQKGIKATPPSAWACVELERLYLDEGRWEDAERIAALKEAGLPNEKDGRYYNYLQAAHYYKCAEDYPTAEMLYKKAIDMHPDRAETYAELGRVYLWWHKTGEAESALRKALTLDPKSSLAYVQLGNIYRDQGKKEQAEEMYLKALECDPANNIALRFLIFWYNSDGRFEEAENLCRRALADKPRDDVVRGMLALCYLAQGKRAAAEENLQQADSLRSNLYQATTCENYRRLKEILTERGVRLVCVQYPMRNVEHLRRIFPNPEGIVFVDNQATFERALQSGTFEEYFIDCFAGDFGHCTRKGNLLLAGNIADAILNEIVAADQARNR